MYDGHLIDSFMKLVDERLANHGYPPPERDPEEQPDIPLVEAA
jgi:hypothetical protein